MKICLAALLCLSAPVTLLPQAAAASTHNMTTSGSEASGIAGENPWLRLMQKAVAHARQHGARIPLLSPVDGSVLPAGGGLNGPKVPVAALQAMGVRVVPWTTNAPDRMRAVIRTGVDGVISDRPDLLQQVLREERAAHPDDERLKRFVVSAHRGGRGLRPENTLPSFENGLDLLATELETDTGVTTDRVSMIWHDQFFHPHSCRKADGSPYTLENRIYLRDISSVDAAKTLICDGLPAGPEQKNDLSLSPVAVAFSRQEGMASPYAPTYVAQLFRFVRFYADYYSSGPGKANPHAAERAANARTVRFNIETKVLPDRLPPEFAGNQDVHVPKEMFVSQAVSPQVFVDTLAGIIAREHMEARAAVQSFDFHTLQLIEEQYPEIQTFYLTDNPALSSSRFQPEYLRSQASK